LLNEKEIVVADNCTQCGAALTPGNATCAACGAQVNAAAPYVAVAQPAAAPVSSGTSAVKIILIVVAIFVGLGMLAVAGFGLMAWRFSRALHVSNNGDQVTLNTAAGSFSASSSQTYTAEELGTDIYPGATGGKGGLKMNLPTGSMVTGVYITGDSKAQVVEFYKSKLGSAASVIDSDNSAIISVDKGQQESVMVTVTANSSQDGGKTRIAIMHSKSKKAS
jgi:hypothetical protein